MSSSTSFTLPTSLTVSPHHPRDGPVAVVPNVQPRRSSRSRYHLTYAEWITRALMASEETRACLADIYEWMAFNVPGLHEQRFLHSSKGWKNAVRHTLSINPRFHKLKRFGKPSLWTLADEYLPQTTDTRAEVTAMSKPRGDDGDSSSSRSFDWSSSASRSGSNSMQLPTVASNSPFHPQATLGQSSPPSIDLFGQQQHDYQRFLASLSAAIDRTPPKSPTQTLRVTTLNGSETSFVLPRPLPMRCLTDQKMLLASLLWPNATTPALNSGL